MDRYFEKVKNSKIILKSSLFVCEDVIRNKFEKQGLRDSIAILKNEEARFFVSYKYLR